MYSNLPTNLILPRMSRITLDSIGIGGFGHDFRALNHSRATKNEKDGELDVMDFLDSFIMSPPSNFGKLILPLLGPLIRLISRLPTKEKRMMQKLNIMLGRTAQKIVEGSRTDGEDTGKSGKSIIETLCESAQSFNAWLAIDGIIVKADSATKISKEEVVDQVHHCPLSHKTSSKAGLLQLKLLILAGYETTSSKKNCLPFFQTKFTMQFLVTLTWALIELALHPDMQCKLRSELREFSSQDPSYDQLMSGFPYLHAVMCEALRLHPAGDATIRRVSIDGKISAMLLPVY
jgi:hypothetical protein